MARKSKEPNPPVQQWQGPQHWQHDAQPQQAFTPENGYPQYGGGYSVSGVQGFGAPTPPPKKRKRIFMWFFLVIQVLFLVWIIAGATSASHSNHCGSDQDCQNATDAGTAIGVVLIIVFWAIVDVILGVTYMVVRLSRRR